MTPEAPDPDRADPGLAFFRRHLLVIVVLKILLLAILYFVVAGRLPRPDSGPDATAAAVAGQIRPRP